MKPLPPTLQKPATFFTLIAALGLPLCASPHQLNGAGDGVQEGIPSTYPRKKLIAAGWDSPTPSALLENLKTMEQTPFDGVRIQIRAKDDEGKLVELRTLFRPESWKREWFLEEIEKLKKAKSEKLTDNFLSVGPGSKIDWFDDDAWKQVVDHFRTAAWIARTAGLKGLFFDPEIGTSLPAFSYNRQLNRERYSFAEYAAKVRQRGREAMQAMAQEYPDMVLFTTFLNGGQGYSPFFSTTGHGGRSSHFYVDGDQVKPAGPKGPLEVQEQKAPLEKIEGGSYNLIPAFVNGWLDAISPEMTIVDGLEQTYTATERSRFIYWAHSVRTTALPLVAPENRLKYRGQVRVGFGIYIDPYTNPPGNRYYIGKSDNEATPSLAPRVMRLGATVREAVETTDEYVWLWGEKHRWWPTDERRVSPETWEEIAPGISDALRNAVDPSIGFKATLTAANDRFVNRSGNEGTNLLGDGSFPEASLGPWLVANGNGGMIGIDTTVGHHRPGSLSFTGGKEAICYQEVAVGKSKSNLYGIQAWVRHTGAQEPAIRIRWKNRKGDHLLTQSDHILLSPQAGEDQDGWKLIRGLVAVPPEIETMVVQLVVPQGTKEDDRVWFDDIGVYKAD